MFAAWELPEALNDLMISGDGDVVQDILETFRSDTEARLKQLREALYAGDRARLKAQAHSIKGSAMQVGANYLAAVCLSIELEAASNPQSQLGHMVAQAEEEFARLCRATDEANAAEENVR